MEEDAAYSIAQSVMNMNLNLANISKHLIDNSRHIIQTYQAGIQHREKLLDFIALLDSSFESMTISDSSKNLISSKLSPYLKNKDYKKKIMNLSFQENIVVTQWPDFEPHMKVTSAVALYDLELNDIASFKEHYAKLKKTLAANRQVLMKLFFIGVGDKERILHEQIEFESHFCLVEDIDIEREAGTVTIQKELEDIIVDIAINMALEFEKLRSDPQNMVFVHMKEEKISDASKMKKRKEGRALKMMGDLGVMLLSNDDSMVYFSESMKILKKVEDNLWLAGCQCSASAIVYAKIKERGANFAQQQQCNTVDLEDEFMWRMREAIGYISKTKFASFFVEITFKYLKILAELNLKIAFNDAVLAFESVYMAAVIDKIEASQCFQQIAVMFGQMGMRRKYGFYLRKAAQLIARENSNVSSKLMSMAAKAYQLHELSPFSEGKKSSEFWLTIQIAFVNEFIESLGDQTRLKTQVIRHVLNVFTHLQSDQLKNLYKNLQEMSPYSPSYDYFLFEQFPLVKRIEIVPASVVVKPNAIEKQGLFIYNPFGNKALQKLKFPQDELIKIKITLLNSLELDLQIDSIVLETTGGDLMNYPSSLFMHSKEKEVVVEQNLKALRSGNLSIEGVRFRVFNTVFEQAIDERGFGMMYMQRQANQYLRIISDKQQQRSSLYDLRNITILEKMPFLTAELQGEDDSCIVFEKSQKLTFQINLRNSGELPITKLRVQACIDFNAPPSKESFNLSELVSFSFEEIGDVKIPPGESFKLIFVEQGLTIDAMMTANQKVLMIPTLKQPSFEAREVSFTVGYMEKSDSAYLKEIAMRKRIYVKESISISSMKIIEQNQNYVDHAVVGEDHRDVKLTNPSAAAATTHGYQNYYLNAFFYLQVSLSKPIVTYAEPEDATADQMDMSALRARRSSSNPLGMGGAQSIIAAENRYTLTFMENGLTIDQCDLSETQSQRGLTKIFKLSKTALRDQQHDLNALFGEMFAVKWKDAYQFSEGLLQLPSMDEQVLQRILVNPITVTTQFEKVREERLIQTYEGKYSVKFMDLADLKLSAMIVCSIEVLPLGETNAEQETAYFSVDGKTKFNVQLEEIRDPSERNVAEIQGTCEVNVYGLEKKKPYVFYITITDAAQAKQYNYQETISL